MSTKNVPNKIESTGTTAGPTPGNGLRPGIGKGFKSLLLFMIPVVLLGVVIAIFVSSGGAGLRVQPAAPIENLVFEKTELGDGYIDLHVRNTSPQEITLAQVNIRDALVPFTVAPSAKIPRLGSAVVHIPYPWVEGEAYGILIFSSNSVPFETEIEVATATKAPDSATVGSLTLVGIYVGVIPIFLGIFWLPALRRLGKRAFLWLMALTVGLLIFLGIDATNEAIETAAIVGGPFQGIGLVAIGIAVTAMLLFAVSRRQTGLAVTDENARSARVALMISVGIGLHNFGEGLAIGAAFAIGAASLGTFLVIGFILQNITEGLGIIAPIVKRKPTIGRLALLGLIGGAPAIIGAWAGGLIYSPVLSLLFLSVGAGAVFEVAYEIAMLIKRDPNSAKMPFTIVTGVLSGMGLLYLTGLIIK